MAQPPDPVHYRKAGGRGLLGSCSKGLFGDVMEPFNTLKSSQGSVIKAIYSVRLGLCEKPGLLAIEKEV